MSTLIVVKHGRNSHKVDIGQTKSLSIFKTHLHAITKIKPERQTIISKGRKIKSEADFGKLEGGQKVLLIGTAATVAAPIKNTVFVEDRPGEDLVGEFGAGLINTNNTCYMNSVIQVLRGIPLFKESLTRYAVEKKNSDKGNLLLIELGALFAKMESGMKTVNPAEFWNLLMNAFPQLSEKTKMGGFKQQDAEECFNLILGVFKEELGQDFVSIFGGRLITETTCLDNPQEKTLTDESDFQTLKCHINVQTDHMAKGVEKSLEETVSKRGATSADDFRWLKRSRLQRLPEFLVIHFVRFFWKKEIQDKAKIMRQVSFPVDGVLDVFHLCSDELKEAATNRKMVGPLHGKARLEEDKQTRKGTSKYKLQSVITHQGAYADSGHYVAWGRKEGSQKWALFDDSKVELCGPEEIKKLFGGGEWHSAYLAVYRRMKE